VSPPRLSYDLVVAADLQLGSFLLGAPLGSGGTATVYRAVHVPTGAEAAVKVVRTTPDRRPMRHDLAAEVRAVVALDHPNIIAVYDVGTVEAETAETHPALVAGTPWYAMELAGEGSLRRRTRTLDWPDLLPILRALLDALAHAHARDVLHLDLKPANVLFGGRGAGAKLSDFGMGLVGRADPDDDFVRGTPHYMAPEQARGRWEELGPWTDLYALGCLAWRCVTGGMPIPDDPPEQVLHAQIHDGPGAFEPRFDVPPPLEGWIRRLLQKDPAGRYRFAADAHRALLEVAELEPGPRLPLDWRVSDRLAAADVLPVTGLGLGAIREPPMVGRTRERERLWGALLDAAAGRVRVVVLRGPIGVGKTRLARWLGVRAHELGASVVLAGGHRRDRLRREDGLLGALRSRYRIGAHGRAIAETELGSELQALGLAAPAARAAASLLARGPDAEPGLAETWFELAAELLHAAAAERTPVVLLDDVHWAGASLDCARWILAQGRSPPAVWVLTVDDEALVDRRAEAAVLDAILALPSAEVLPLGPLSEQARATLSRRILPLEPSASAEVVRQGAGSPRLQVDLVHDWAQRGFLEHGPDGFRLRPGQQSPGPPDPAQVTAALERALGGRAGWAASLEVAAILGVDVDMGEWQSACAELGLDGTPALVSSLVEHALVSWVGEDVDRWAFVQPLARAALASRVEREGRAAAIHLACARVVDPRHAERRARHLLAADRPDEALPALLEALASAGVEDVGRASQLLRTVEEVASRGVPADDPRWAAIEDHRVHLLLALGRPDEAREGAVRQRAAAGADPVALFHAERNLSAVAAELGDEAGALAHASAAERFAGTVGDPLLLLGAWVASGSALRAVGRIEEARAEVEWASLLAVDQHPKLLDLWLEMALVAVAQGRLAVARRSLERLEVTAEALGARSTTAVAALRSGDAWLAAGEAERAMVQYQAARRRFRALGHADEALAQLGLAASLVALGRDDEAEEALDRVRSRTLPARHRLRLALVEVALRAARPADPAWAVHWREARSLLEGHGGDPGLPGLLQVAIGRAQRPERLRELTDERDRVTPIAPSDPGDWRPRR
jgi:eukaryotic-like serine/threonine-protein kinase